jgi:hypothetical protein
MVDSKKTDSEEAKAGTEEVVALVPANEETKTTDAIEASPEKPKEPIVGSISKSPESAREFSNLGLCV